MILVDLNNFFYIMKIKNRVKDFYNHIKCIKYYIHPYNSPPICFSIFNNLQTRVLTNTPNFKLNNY